MKKNIAVATIARTACSSVFIAVAVVSVGMRAAPALKAEAIYQNFTELSALSAPAPRQEPVPDNSETEPITEPEAEQEPSAVDSEDGYEIVPVNISLSDGSGSILFKNETKYTFDSKKLLAADYPISTGESDEPLVLILHTHATESYAEEGSQYVYDTRSTDPENNMIAVGAALTEALKENGVAAIQCTRMHDEVSYNDSYRLSSESAEEYLKQYPSIKYIIDVHRDAIETADGGMAKPVISCEGQDLAQVMLVVGTNQGGADHPNWETNLTVAVQLQKQLIAFNEDFARPINVRSASFNQQNAPGSLLLEIGTCANTLSEAKASAVVFAKVFAALVKNP